MEFFKKEYPDTGDVAVDVTYVSFRGPPAGHPKGERDVPGRVCETAGHFQAGPQPL